LACSSADPLFLSWEWLTHWWQCYGASLGRAPDILAFYRGEDLVGLAPLYHRRVMRGLLLAHSVQVIGLSWRDSEPLISEYLDVIAAPQDLGAVRHACLRLLLDEPAWTELAIGYSDLNRLHQLRWSRPAFTGKRLAFHRTLASRLATHAELAFSRLRVGGDVVSVLYDIRKGARQYNIKMAFDPAFSSRVSLGLIHLGYATENAADHGITSYDFLAGPGRASDYKRHLSQSRRALSCVQMLRGRILPALYRWRDHAR